MPASKSRLFIVFISTAILTALPVSRASGQAAAPAAPASADSTRASQPTLKPRPPTHKDVAELKTAMDWPGSIITFVAIVGNYALVGGVSGPIGDEILASNATGKWVQIADPGGGAFGPDDLVQEVPGISLPVALALTTQAQRGNVYWSGGFKGAEFDKKLGAYGDYLIEGDEAAGRGDFDGAIAAWTKAAAIDFGDLKSCGDLSQRVDIRAAKDAKARMNDLHLAKEQAAAWFEEHRVELWKARKGCRLP